MMNKGYIFLAPGQRQEVIDGITRERTGWQLKVRVDPGLPVDFALGTPFQKRVMGEIKEVPNDLVSSLRKSSRFSRQAIDLGANEGPSIYLMVGYPHWQWVYDRGSGARNLMMMRGHHETGLTYGEFQMRMLDFAMIGVLPMFVPTWDEVGDTIANIYIQFQKMNHTSYLIRPSFAGGNIMESWPKPTSGDKILHIWQGFESVGRGKAKDLWKAFGSFRTFALADEKYYAMVPGIGKVTASKIRKQVDAEYGEYYKDEDKK